MRTWLIPQWKRLRTNLSEPRRRALLTASFALGLLLPTWWLAGRAYEGQLVVEVAGLVIVALATGVTYLIANRQVQLAKTIEQRSAELSRLSQQLQEDIARRMQVEAERDSAALEERQRLARELHDSVTQLIYGEMLMAEASRQMIASGDLTTAHHYLERLGETAQQALKEMRLLLFELRPPSPIDEGLAAALQRRFDAVEKRAGLEAQLLANGEIDLPPAVEEVLYRVAQEALNNSLKHAAATSVAIELRAKGHMAEMIVSDNGRGFDPSSEADRGGFGLTTMRQRVRRLGGSLAIESSPGTGTLVQVKMPLDHDSRGPQGRHGTGSLREVS